MKVNLPVLRKTEKLRMLQPNGQKNNAPHAERFLDRRALARILCRCFNSGFKFHGSIFCVMSYLSIALQRRIERRQLNQTDLAKQSGISKSYISRLFSGEHQDMSEANFVALLNVFATDPGAQAEIIAARCQDLIAIARKGRVLGVDLVEVHVKKSGASAASQTQPLVDLSQETERAFAWLRSQCPLNPDLEKHLVGYAKLTGMK